MVEYFVGDLLTGRRINQLRVLGGMWSEPLNGAGEVSCTVSLRDPAMRKLNLLESAVTGKAFLAAFDGETGLQGGPIWAHDWDDDNELLTLRAGGMWSYFDDRALLPILAGRLPSDETTDTRFMPVDADPDSAYPWPTDTRTSLQGIARALVAQAQTETNGNVPVVLPAEIAGTAERAYRGSDVAMVGQRLSELTEVLGGPDIRFGMRWKVVGSEVEWVMQIGTPTQPLISSLQELTFYVGTSKSSVSKLKVKTSGDRIGARAFSSGGASSDQSLVAVAVDPTLTDAGFPLLDLVGATRSTVGIIDTLTGYANELVLRGRKPNRTFSFTHDLSTSPFLSSLNVGDFAKVRVSNNSYLPDGEYRMRVTSRSGDSTGKTVDLTFAPEVF
jgi:hypothetical protein